MNPSLVLAATGGTLVAAGVVLLLERSLSRLVVGVLVLSNGVNLLILTSGGPAGAAPILTGRGPHGGPRGLAPILGYADPEEMSDPLPQALILTAIVITFGVAAFVLAMIHRSWALARNEAVGTDEEDRRVAGRLSTDADELDPDDLAPEDRPAGHADSLSTRRRAEPLADDVDLPLPGGGT